MVATPTETKAKVRKNSVQSKWEIKRRSICKVLSVGAHLLFIGCLFLLFGKFLEDFFGHGCRRVAAVAAVLDQHGDGDLWIVDRRVGNEPGMISIEVGELFALQVGAFHLDDLGSAGFTCDLDNWGSRRAAGAARAAHDVGQRAAYAV